MTQVGKTIPFATKMLIVKSGGKSVEQLKRLRLTDDDFQEIVDHRVYDVWVTVLKKKDIDEAFEKNDVYLVRKAFETLEWFKENGVIHSGIEWVRDESGRLSLQSINKVVKIVPRGLPDITTYNFCPGFVKNDNKEIDEIMVKEGYIDCMDKDMVYNTLVLETPLIYSCRKGNIQRVKFLLDNGANVNWTYNNITDSSLMAAAQYNEDTQLLRMLVERGANVNYRIEREYTGTALGIACSQLFEDVRRNTLHLSLDNILYLLNAGASINYGKGDAIVIFTKHITDNQWKDRNEVNKINQIIRIMLRRGSDVKASDYQGTGVLPNIANVETLDILVKSLKANTGDKKSISKALNWTDYKTGYSALSNALKREDWNFVRYIINEGASYEEAFQILFDDLNKDEYERIMKEFDKHINTEEEPPKFVDDFWNRRDVSLKELIDILKNDFGFTDIDSIHFKGRMKRPLIDKLNELNKLRA